jgi:hypothetical protein
LIAGARTHIETQSQVALITQGWRIVLDCWSCGQGCSNRSKPRASMI